MTSSGEIDRHGSECDLFSVQSVNKVSAKYFVSVKINDHLLQMELDTAADVSIISQKWMSENLPRVKIKPSSVFLKDYNEKSIKVSGEATVSVSYENQKSL